MTPKHEFTSWKVSRIASKVMRMAAKSEDNSRVIWSSGTGTLTIAEVEALAGSCLTQAKDRLKKKAK